MKKRILNVVTVLLIGSLFMLVSCASQLPIMRTEVKATPIIEFEKKLDVVLVTIPDIYFDFDSSLLTDDAKAILVKNAPLLKGNDLKINIQGHCDVRGTDEYNIELGKERAISALNFLIELGIDSSRMTFQSFGEQEAVGEDHQLNRRDHFEIK